VEEVIFKQFKQVIGKKKIYWFNKFSHTIKINIHSSMCCSVHFRLRSSTSKMRVAFGGIVNTDVKETTFHTSNGKLSHSIGKAEEEPVTVCIVEPLL